MALQYIRITRVSASVKTAFAFFFVWCHNTCVSHACLHLLRRLLRFLRIALQCMRFTRVSASVKTTFAFFFVSRYNAYVSHACLNRLRRLLRFPLYGVTIYSIIFLFRIAVGPDEKFGLDRVRITEGFMFRLRD